jgi:hypothetical protein
MQPSLANVRARKYKYTKIQTFQCNNEEGKVLTQFLLFDFYEPLSTISFKTTFRIGNKVILTFLQSRCTMILLSSSLVNSFI